MAFTAFRNMKPLSQLVFAAFVVLSSFLIFMILALIIAIPIFGVDAAMSLTNVQNISDPESIKMLKYIQVVQSIGLFIIPAIVLAQLYSGKYRSYLFLNKSFSSPSFLLVFLLVLFAGPFVNLLSEINSAMVLPGWLSGVEDWMREAEKNAEDLTKAFLKVENLSGLGFNLFMIALLPAIGEEFLFRGVVQGLFTRLTRNYHLGIWISAILFSALHLQFYGFIPRMFLGALFGYLLVWSGSMWLPVLAHFINNAAAVIVMFLVDHGHIGEEMETIGSEQGSYYLAGISLLLIVVFMGMIKRENRDQTLAIQ